MGGQMASLSEIIAGLKQGLSFYRQERVDGGIRTGIMLGMATIFERFEIEGEEWDPSLAWSVELRCSGSSLPTGADDVKPWLLAHEGQIRDAFRRFSDQLAAGSDPTGDYPLQFADFHDLPAGVSMKIVCTALRRYDALFLAEHLNHIREHWSDLVRDLEPTFHRIY
jgi:hypothetical protein